MYQGRSGRSLGERAADSGVPGAAALDGARTGSAGRDSDVPEAGSAAPADGRHCWVHDPPGVPGRWPGLLVEWRQRHGAWEGRVAYTVASARGPVLVEGWLPADRLQPR